MSKKTSITEEELLRRRVAHADWLGRLFEDPSSIAAQTVAAYSELLDEALMDVAVESQRHARTEAARCQPLHSVGVPPAPVPLPPAPGTKGPVDVFGQSHPVIASEVVTCLHCTKKVVAGRFANHLQSCLGMGRAAARGVSRRTAGHA